MPRYTPDKVEQCLKSLDKLTVLRENQLKLTNQLRNTLERIRFAMYDDFDKAIRDMVEKKTREELKKLDTEDSDNWKYKNHKGIAKMKAKTKLMNEFRIICNVPLHERWSEFIFVFKKQWEKDRAKLIKDGEIEVSKIK